MDVSKLAEMGPVLRRAGLISELDQARIAIGLSSEGRFDEALAWLIRLTAAGAGSADHWILTARVLAGRGDFDMALRAALTAIHADPDSSQASALVSSLEALQALSTSFALDPTWSLCRRLIDGCLEFGAQSAAARALRRAVEGADPEMDPLDDVIHAARAAAELEPRADLEPLIDRLKRIHPQSDAILALRIEHELRSGRIAEADELAGRGERQPDGSKALRCAIAAAHHASGRIARAIDVLGALSARHERDLELLNSLAFYVGEQVVADCGLTFAPPHRRKVFNLIPFNKELTLLDMRLHEMADWVDHFVIVEAAQTFTGLDKSLYFQENAERFGAFAAKLLYVPIDRFPKDVNTAWAREFYQRDMAVSAISGLAAPDDLVLITDADEIVRRNVVEDFDGEMCGLRMRMFLYFFNFAATKQNRKKFNNRAGAICRARHLAQFGSSYMRSRLSRFNKDWRCVSDAGWHFTSVNDAAAVSDKFRSYSHQGASKALWRDESQVAALLQGIRAGQSVPGWGRIKLDSRLPEYLHAHRDELKELLL